MFHRVASAAVVVAVVSLMLSVGCSRAAPRLQPPAIDAASAGAKAIEQYDANKDGKISGAELDKAPALKAAIARIDAGGAGEITADKIAARIKVWQESKSARMPLRCTVLHNGKPLAGAEVKFVPEAFLGENMKTATGKTDPNGVAELSIPTAGSNDPPGVAPGFYRVEIAKSGENIPAKYNSQTTLGQEAAVDTPENIYGIKFDLRY